LIWASDDIGNGKLMCRKNCKWDVWGGVMHLSGGGATAPPPVQMYLRA